MLMDSVDAALEGIAYLCFWMFGYLSGKTRWLRAGIIWNCLTRLAVDIGYKLGSQQRDFNRITCADILHMAWTSSQCGSLRAVGLPNGTHGFQHERPSEQGRVALIFTTEPWKTQNKCSAAPFPSRLSHACFNSRRRDVHLLEVMTKNLGGILNQQSFIVHLTYCALSS